MDLTQKIRQARKEADLSQQDLSKAVGVSDKAISAYEVGRSSPPIKVLEKISAATGKPIKFFVEADQSETTPDQIIAKLDAVETELRLLRQAIQDQTSE